MHALPAAPAPPPRRQVLVGTTLAGVATIMLMGAMLAIWVLLRERALDSDGFWVPEGVTIPEVPTNVMLIGLTSLLVFAHWAIYAARRQERAHTALALGLVAVIGLAVINAQAFVYTRMGMPVAEGAYPGMFYAVTGTMVALFVIGIVFTAVTAFRFLGGRTGETEIVVAHALYWYVLTAAYTALWFVVYVTK